MSIQTKAINKYTDCNHKIIFNGIFHKNRNIPHIRLLILNRILNSQKDSEKEEHSWRHLPLWLQTTSQSYSNPHSEELARTQTRGLEEGIESPGVKPHIRGQFMNIKNWEWAKRKGQSSQETGTGKLATCTEEHHRSSSRSSNRNLTENPLFSTCRTEAKAPILWPLGWLIEKDPDAAKD